MKILFICGRNQKRSPTAENIFKEIEGIETRSAGVSYDSLNKVNPEDINWADKIIFMEKSHKDQLNKKHNEFLKDKKFYVLNIPDKYEYMDEPLIKILRFKLKDII